MTGAFAAADLGATSGRVVVGRVGPAELSITEVHRFANSPVPLVDGLHWDILGLYHEVLDGLSGALRNEPGLASVGVDSWAVDYGLLRGQRLLGNPYHYREERTADAVSNVHGLLAPTELYRTNGLQFQPFNTVYQLTADAASGLLAAADSFLLLPDLLAFWLTGRRVAERTNASTTGLFNVSTRGWDEALIERLSLPRGLFPELVEPGESVGALRPEVAEGLGASGMVDVVAVGSHDTASAVVAVPMLGNDAAYISSGTWSLVGLELDRPVLTEASRRANFTNEGGVDGRIRYLRNVMGLWLLSEAVRTWQRQGLDASLAQLLEQAEDVTTQVPVIDANDARFLAPGDIPRRIGAYCSERGLAPPQNPAEFVRTIIESLAAAYAAALEEAQALSGTRVRSVHVVGGGSQNELLCQLTADRCGLPVLAGPVEATAIGNVLVQARAAGVVSGDLTSMRQLVADAFPARVYRPRA